MAAICQPHYLPWIGYFEMIDRVDTFVYLDDVQFVRREWKNRNRIRKDLRSAETKWLTVPVEKAPWPGLPIDRTLVRRDRDWFAEHRHAIRTVHAKSPHAALLGDLLERIAAAAEPAEDLATLNIETTRVLCEQLGITTAFARASTFDVPGRKTEKLHGLLKCVGANHYLANDASRVYLDRDLLAGDGIGSEFQGYEHPVYAQHCGREELPFVSHLSVLDLIANAGDGALDIIRSGRTQTRLPRQADQQDHA